MKNILFITFLFFAFIPPMSGADRMHKLLFISDTQAPLMIETIRVPSTNNEEATQAIYAEILRQNDVDAVFHLGDITSIGMFDWYWSSFDAFHASLRVPLYAVPGNHDYFFFASLAVKQFRRRFPDLWPAWYTKRFGSIAVVALNSNFSKLSDKEQQRQESWYTAELEKLDRDNTVSTVIVVCHHPPFTNSMVVEPSAEVRENFVKPFARYPKCRVFLSGHAHTYERFHENGKEFFVTGGVGGLLHPLKHGNAQSTRDVAALPDSMRFFHYLECTEVPNGLRFSVHVLRRDLSGFTVADTFTVLNTH